MGREILTLPPPPYDHKIAYGGDPFQFGYLRLPKSGGPHPVAVVIHGGFWRAAFDLEHSGHLCAATLAPVLRPGVSNTAVSATPAAAGRALARTFFAVRSTCGLWRRPTR